jgi:hypothetical protein
MWAERPAGQEQRLTLVAQLVEQLVEQAQQQAYLQTDQQE